MHLLAAFRCFVFPGVLRPETVEHDLGIDKLTPLPGQVMGRDEAVGGATDEEIPIRPDRDEAEIVVEQVAAGAGDEAVQAALGEVEAIGAVATLKRVFIRGGRRVRLLP